MKKANYKFLLLGLIVSSTILFLGCKDEENDFLLEQDKVSSTIDSSSLVNKVPSLSFSEPTSGVTISKDSLLTFVAQPLDADGSILCVQFMKNGELVHTSTESPYKYSWDINHLINTGTHQVKAITFDNDSAFAKDSVSVNVVSYLSNWIGSYSGSSRHWRESPGQINGQWQMITRVENKPVNVEVSLGSVESSLDLWITYDNDSTQRQTWTDLSVNSSGSHSSSWGSGSSAGSLSVRFSANSLSYSYFSKCGIPCSSGISFTLQKNI